MQRFEDRVVIITGSGSGMGEATARRFSSEGANVVLVARTQERLEQVARSLPADRTLVHAADVADEDKVNAMIEATAERFGRLDVLVNNAGTIASGEITEASTSEWRRVLGTDLDGVFFACRAAIPYLAETRGCIVNTASVSGIGGDWGMSIYNAAKGAVVNFTRALALDCGARGIRVNAVCPTLTRTNMTTEVFEDEGLLSKFRERIPLGHPAEPEDIAGVVAFLASDDARFVNGVNLPVDGGLSASNGQPRQH